MKSIFFLLMAFPIVSQAEIGTRGGGNVRVCFTQAVAAKAARQNPLNREAYWDAIDSIELLDLYEAKLPRGEEGLSFEIMDSPVGESPTQFAERVRKRFELRLRPFANTIGRGIQTFSKAQVVWSQEPIGTTDDIDSAYSYENEFCSILGLAVQKTVAGQEKIYIDQKLFQHPKHSQLSRNMTFLHEFIYFKARQANHRTSVATREAVGFAVASLPKGVSVDNAEAWGLSVRQITTFLAQNSLITDQDDYGFMLTYFQLADDLKFEEQFKKFHRLLAEDPESKIYREKMNAYFSYGERNDLCPKIESSSASENIVMSSCLNYLRSLTEQERKEVRKFVEFLNKLAQDKVLPTILKEVEVSLQDRGIPAEMIRVYQNLLATSLKGNTFVNWKDKHEASFGLWELALNLRGSKEMDDFLSKTLKLPFKKADSPQ